MGKDELLWAVDRAFHHSKPGRGIDLLSIKNELDRIINLHFSISDSEREEAVEKIEELIKISNTKLLLSSSEEDKEYARVWETTLKTLKEVK